MPSRAAAIRELLRRELLAEGVELAEAAGWRSSNFGVLSDGETRTPVQIRRMAMARRRTTGFSSPVSHCLAHVPISDGAANAEGGAP